MGHRTQAVCVYFRRWLRRSLPPSQQDWLKSLFLCLRKAVSTYNRVSSAPRPTPFTCHSFSSILRVYEESASRSACSIELTG
jgi:hypothetical protein